MVQLEKFTVVKKFTPLGDLMRRSLVFFLQLQRMGATKTSTSLNSFLWTISQSHETISLTILQVEKEGVRQEPRAAAAPVQVAENPRPPAIEAGQPSFLYLCVRTYLREVFLQRGISSFFPICTLFNTASSAAPQIRFHCVGGLWDWTQNCFDFGIYNLLVRRLRNIEEQPPSLHCNPFFPKTGAAQ